MKSILSSLAVLAVTVNCLGAQDLLPSWNDGPAKHAIVDFVKSTTTAGGEDFVPPEERIATFDQDGTLWVEHPMYLFVMYALDRVSVRCTTKQSNKAGSSSA
jgi:hypothetical protein